jgi:hypothetical protein
MTHFLSNEVIGGEVASIGLKNLRLKLLWLLATVLCVEMLVLPLRNFGKRFLPSNKADADVLATKDP